jgi:hypothetical protein
MTGICEFMLISKLRTDGGTQARATIREDVVDEYAAAVTAGIELPPLTVFQDEAGEHWLADGFHRLGGYKKAGKDSAPVEIRDGSLRDARMFAAGANDSHGLRRSNEDKRRAVLLLLEDEEWGKASDRWIAERCRVSDHTVARVRAELASEDRQHPADTANKGQSGGESARRAQMRTSNNQTSATSGTRTDKKGRRQPARKPRKTQDKPCQRCFTIKVPACPACRKKWPNGFPSEWLRQAGDDGDDLRQGKNGQPKHDFKGTDDLLGKLIRAFEACGNAYGRGPRYTALDGHMREVATEWKAWTEECTNA